MIRLLSRRILLAVLVWSAFRSVPAEAALLRRAKAELAARRAVEKLRAGDHAEAAAALSSARQDGADEASVSFDLALALSMAGKTQDALREYRRAVSAAEKAGDRHLLARAWYNLGVELCRRGALADALEAFRSAIRNDPSDEDARFNHELVRKLLEKTRREARQRRQREQDLQKRLEDILRRLAELVAEQGKATASLWSLFPDTLPRGGPEPDAARRPPSGNALGTMGRRVLKALKEAFAAPGHTLPPLKPGMTREETALWIKKAFHPQPPPPSPSGFEAEERRIASETGAVAKALSRMAESLSPGNPLSKALSGAKGDLEQAIAGLAAAAGAATASPPAPSRASESAVGSEQRLIAALLRFLKPPRSSGGGDGKSGKKPAGKQQKNQGKQGEGKQPKPTGPKTGKAPEQPSRSEEKEPARPLSKEDAKRLLDSLERNDSEVLKELLRRRATLLRKAHPGNVEKNW